MRGYNYIAGDWVYRTVPNGSFVPKGTKGTVGHCRRGAMMQVHFDNGHIWYCSVKFIKPLVRVVG
ncbi:hypothetical protein ACBA6_012 [Acinetobacter phage Acba_6]|uniref:Uncharacterized protein n=1 Tax=Acinetobacter phage Acba_6 TaxID=3024175 RepID=A0AAF0BBS6_9CAUD|nr:hypothetical protein ACBA6_012 [Acinetobacter phage Acba_6]